MKRPLLTALLAISLTLPVSAQEPSFYSLLISPARPAKLKVSAARSLIWEGWK